MNKIVDTKQIVNKDFKFKAKDYNNYIDEMDKDTLKIFCLKIVKIKDPFHSFFLLLSIKTDKQFLDEILAKKITSLLERIEEHKYLSLKRLDKKIFKFLLQHTEKNSSIVFSMLN